MTTELIKNMEISKPQNHKIFSGFPWLFAIIIYTISWGWSLIRPSTLYWDDWAFIFNRPKPYLNNEFVSAGMPPWRALLDQELLGIGYWTIRWLTFVMFFMAGVFLFEILKKIPLFTATQNRYIVLLFLIIPVNHARISLTMFGYTSSYFLFFLAWFLLIRSFSLRFYFLALFCFSWSLMTHSFLFFLALPIAHFLYLLQKDMPNRQLSKSVFYRVAFLIFLPVSYLTLRHQFWSPTGKYVGYHSITLFGTMRGLALLIFFIICALTISFVAQRSVKLTQGSYSLLIGSFSVGYGLLPYFMSDNIPSYISMFAFRSDWDSRDLMLIPLGVAVTVTAVLSIFGKKVFRYSLLVVMILFSVSNTFFGAQYYLDSLKKEQLIDLFKSDLEQFDNSEIIFVDNTKIFNGRGSTYRNAELSGLNLIANSNSAKLNGKTSCEESPNGKQLILKSHKNFVSALITGDLGLYSDINPCKTD